MASTTQVYSPRQTKVRLVSAIKKNRREATLADLMAATGLPKREVDRSIKLVCDEYRGHLRVTESGDIVYYFPYGMSSQRSGLRNRAGRFLRRVGRGFAKMLTLLFKIWTAVMLVGYFVLFVGLFVLMVVASIAASVAGRGRSRGGGFMGFFLVTRVLQIFAWIWLYGGAGSYRQPRARRRRGRPLHQAVFAYLFGDQKPDKDWTDRERRYLIAFIRSRKGVLTLLELMVITGKSPAEAQQYINRLLVEFEGEPAVTEQGTLVFFFPELLKSEGIALNRAGNVTLLNPQKKPILPFNDNERKVNRRIGFFNGFNVLFSSYFLFHALADPEPLFRLVRGVRRLQPDFSYLYHFVNGLLRSFNMEPAVLIILIVLGIIPLCYSVFFILIPLIRRYRIQKQNERTKRENFRKQIYFHVLGSADSVVPEEIRPASLEETPRQPHEFATRVLDELVAVTSGEIEDSGGGRFTYRFPEIDRELRDIEAYRKGIDLTRFEPGKTVYDSNE